MLCFLRSMLARMMAMRATAIQHVAVRVKQNLIALIMRGDFNPVGGQETTPFKIISVDYRGDFTTFSPELLGQKSELYGDFVLGNVETDSFDDTLRKPKFQKMRSDIEAGIKKCSSCPYFGLCGGGAPSNKYFENGSFDSTETVHCLLSKRVLAEVVLDRLERGNSIHPEAVMSANLGI